MFERFTPPGRTVVIHAQQHARRLGHGYIGCEHLLLALVGTAEPAADVLREYGLSPDRVEEQVVRQVGLGGAAGVFGDLDRDALSSIGIDVDAVRASIAASFGSDALMRAGKKLRGGKGRSRLDPRRLIPHPLRRIRRRRGRAAVAPSFDVRPPDATGRYQTSGARPSGHLPFTSDAKRSLSNAVLEAQSRHDPHIGVEHLALGLLAIRRGPLPAILATVDAPEATLRAAILERYRKAS